MNVSFVENLAPTRVKHFSHSALLIQTTITVHNVSCLIILVQLLMANILCKIIILKIYDWVSFNKLIMGVFLWKKEVSTYSKLTDIHVCQFPMRKAIHFILDQM